MVSSNYSDLLKHRLRVVVGPRGWRALQKGRRLARALKQNSRRRLQGLGFVAAPPDAPDPTPPPAATPSQLPDRAGGPRVPSHRSFRVLFVVRPGVMDAACMRYRGYNVMEALRLSGIESAHLDDRHIPERLAEALSFDLIVLVRRHMTPEIALLLEGAERFSVPVVCDLDDYLFDDEVIPYIEFFRQLPIETARSLVRAWRAVPERCNYFTGSTPHLTERAATLGISCYLIRNGLNEAQLELSRLALERAREAPAPDGVRLGYFSGTRTHQDDFRLIAPVLRRLMDELPTISLVVAGNFDLAEFPEFGRFTDRVEGRPFVDWRLLPAEIARVDINLIPLEINPFTEGKSDLKYYEAALLQVPSVATPARVYTSCITHGVNGFLAQTTDEWYESLRALILDPGLRQQVGGRAYRHALREYVPSVVANEAVSAYREMLLHYRRGLGVADDAPTVVVLLSGLGRAIRDRAPALRLSFELVRAGACLTLLLPEGPAEMTAARAGRLITEHFAEPPFTIQVGGEIPCCDILLATNPATAHRAKRSEHRARWTGYLVSEYEPAHLPHGEERERALQSYSLGFGLLTLDSAVADLLMEHHHAQPTVLPPWVEARPLAAGAGHVPRTVLVAATSSLPEHAWVEAVAALDRIRADHPDVQIVLCGDAALRGTSAGLPYHGPPRLDGAEYEALISERPVCVTLYPSKRPLWVYDLMAAGCPVIAVNACAGRPLAAPESAEGLIGAHADAGAIARAVDSLLVDHVRLSALTHRAVERAGELPDACEAARALLRAYDPAGSPIVSTLRRDDRSSRDPIAQVA